MVKIYVQQPHQIACYRTARRICELQMLQLGLTSSDNNLYQLKITTLKIAGVALGPYIVKSDS